MDKYNKILSELLIRITALEDLVIAKNIVTDKEISDQIKKVAEKISEAYKNEISGLTDLNTKKENKKFN